MAEEEDCSILKLIMEKGPLAGQTRCFRSGTEIKIGRIARGNTIAIKDGGISSKHASISSYSKPGRVGSWTISDLDSSNGTFLNGQALEPFTPAQLSDGDVIKIGEWTSVIVKFEDIITVDVEENKVKRYSTRRKGRNLVVIDEDKEMASAKDDKNKENVRGRNRRGKAVLQKDNNAVGRRFDEGEKRVTRSSARNRNGVEREVVELEIFERRAGSRKNGKKKEEILVKNGTQAAKEIGHSAQNEVEGEDCTGNNVGVKPKGMQEDKLKRIAESVNDEQDLVILSADEVKSSKMTEMALPIQSKDGGGNLRKEEYFESLGERNNRRTRGKRGKKNIGIEALMENGEDADIDNSEKVEEMLNSEIEMLEEVKENSQVKEMFQEEDKGLDVLPEEGARIAEECCKGLASTSGAVQNDGDELDLEKMTLGEWFDYLEVRLPKQIIDATEAMILEMRQKAEKFHEFMLQQKNSKSET